MSPRVWLITGANRGIGLGLTKELINRGHKVIATCRRVSEAPDLQAMKSNQNLLSIEELDVTSMDSINQLKALLIQSNLTPIHGLINNAGIFTKRGPNNEDYQSSIFDIPTELFVSHFSVNTLGPLNVMRTLYEILDRNTADKFPVVATIGSNMGSIGNTTNGSSPHYRVTKCAAHFITKIFAMEVKDCCFVNLHPGWVKTDMGSQKAPVTVEKSVEGLANVLESLTMQNSGEFFDYTGASIPY